MKLVQPVNQSDPFLWAAQLGLLGAVYLISRWVCWLAMFAALRPWIGHRDSHWTVQARLSWPGRRVGAFGFPVIVLPVAILLALDGRRIDVLPQIVASFLVVSAVFAGVLRTRIEWERQLCPAMALTRRADRGAWISNISVTGFSLFMAFFLFGLVFKTGGRAAWAIVICGALGVGIYFAWGWIWLMRALGVFRPASGRFRTIAGQAANQDHVRLRRVEEIELPVANAFAFISSRSIGVTEAALAILTDEELAAVCAHEVAHLNEPQWVAGVRLFYGSTVRLWIVIPAVLLALHQTAGPDSTANGIIASGIVVVLYVMSAQLFLRTHRRMEIRADGTAKDAQATPGTYARALEKIHASSMIPMVFASTQQGHPELYDRLIEAGATPDYPRPHAPSRWPLYVGMLTLFFGTTAAVAGLNWLAQAVANL